MGMSGYPDSPFSLGLDLNMYLLFQTWTRKKGQFTGMFLFKENPYLTYRLDLDFDWFGF